MKEFSLFLSALLTPYILIALYILIKDKIDNWRGHWIEVGRYKENERRSMRNTDGRQGNGVF